MKILHSSWFAAMALEVFALKRPFIPALSAGAFALFAAGQALRYAAIRTLGWRWSIRIMILPGAEPVRSGIYRFIRHPNYLGVILEMAAVPLLHSACYTALIYTAANALLLRNRIQAEEEALNDYNHYRLVFENRPRFLPAFLIRERD
jgi:methyltransferase